MKWEVVIGLETHAQLSTASKMFSGAATAFGAGPNTQACAVDIALPGVLPVANREAVAKAVRFGLAVNGNAAANINRRSIFARKNYFYPDLPKGYQISQYEMPIVKGGEVAIVSPTRGEMKVRLTRAHLEEDAGKSLHEGFSDATGIDLNRAGTPLLEIVSEPDMRSAEEAVEYAKALHALVRWIGICDGNMQEGSFRCDANVSVRPAGSDKLGTRREIKNLNSFRFLQQAIEYETQWQIETLEGGGKIEQATVLFDPDRGETRAMRSKEDAHDYRYFPDPDLLPLVVNPEWLKSIESGMPELPQAKRERFINTFSASKTQADLLTASRELAEYCEAVMKGTQKIISDGVLERLFSLHTDKDRDACRFQFVANWMLGEFAAVLKRNEIDIADSPVTPMALAGLISRSADGTLNGKMAKEVFDAMWAGEGDADAIIAKRGLKQISDSGELERICGEVIAANPKQVEDYRAGKDKAFNSLVGQAMKLSKGKANPQQVSDILKRKLAG